MATDKFSKKEKGILNHITQDAFELVSELPNPMNLQKEINHVQKIERKLLELQRYVVFNASLHEYVQQTLTLFEKFRKETLEELREVKKLTSSQREHLDNERRQIILMGYARISEIKNKV